MKYARKTSVPVKKSRAELEALVEKYGATTFVSGWNDKREGLITFKLAGRTIKFVMPSLDVLAADATTQTQRDQIERSAWRGLLLLVKAKLEAVETGYTVFEEEFLPHIVTDDGRTVYERLLPQLGEGKADGPLQLPANF